MKEKINVNYNFHSILIDNDLLSEDEKTQESTEYRVFLNKMLEYMERSKRAI